MIYALFIATPDGHLRPSKSGVDGHESGLSLRRRRICNEDLQLIDTRGPRGLAARCVSRGFFCPHPADVIYFSRHGTWLTACHVSFVSANNRTSCLVQPAEISFSVFQFSYATRLSLLGTSMQLVRPKNFASAKVGLKGSTVF